MQALRSALRTRRRQETSFNGTVSAASKLMRGVGHQSLRNLAEGRTKPWNVSVHTKNEILRVLGVYGISEGDFVMPATELEVAVALLT